MPTIPRPELLERLETVVPALADNDLVRVLTHILFTGDRVLAYNDRIGISAPQQSEFVGAVQGKLLVDNLRVCEGAVDLRLVDGRAQLRVGKYARSNLGYIPLDEYPFTMPEMPDGNTGVLADEDGLFQCIEDCMQSVNPAAISTDELGITVIPNGRAMDFFSTSRVTISTTHLEGNPIKVKNRCILSGDFCRQMLRLRKGAERKRLVVRSDHALFQADDVYLFGRLIHTPRELDFAGTMATHLPRDFPHGMITLDEDTKTRLRRLLALAVLYAEVKDNEAKTRITVSNNVLEMSTVTPNHSNDTRDKVKLADHPDVEAAWHASLLLKNFDRYSDFLLTPKCAILSRENSIHLVATVE